MVAAAATEQLTWDTNSSPAAVLSNGSYDYIYGPTSTPVEQIQLSGSTPAYLNYTDSDDSWLSTNNAGDETGFAGQPWHST